MANDQKIQKVILIMVLLIVAICLWGCTTENKQQDRVESTNIRSESSENQKTKQLIIVTGEYAPYTSEQAAGYGAFTQIVEAALKESGLESEVAFYPWARASEMVESGDAWASFPYGYVNEMAQIYDYSEPVIQGPHKFYYLKSNEKLAQEGADFKRISDFTNYTFGGANDYWYGDKAVIESSGVKVEWANDVDALLKMLYAGRIDFLIEDYRVAEEAIGRLFPDDRGAFATLPNIASQHDYYLIISKNYPNSQMYRDKFNTALQTLKNNGTIDRILRENGLEINQSEDSR